MEKTSSYTSASTSEQVCPKCGKPYIYVGDIPESGFEVGREPFCTCICYHNVPKYTYQSGWVCPKCGASLSPFTSVCPICKPITITYTPASPNSCSVAVGKWKSTIFC